MQVGDGLKDTDSIMDDLARIDPEYANAIVGKWHVTDTEPTISMLLPASASSTTPASFGLHRRLLQLGLRRGRTARSQDTYTTTWMTDKALDWIGKQGDKPWFLWLAENEPHFPFHRPPASLQHYDGLTDTESDIEARPRAYVKAQAEALDTEMGRLLASMDPQVRANTTIIFVGDNGTDQDVVAAPYQPRSRQILDVRGRDPRPPRRRGSRRHAPGRTRGRPCGRRRHPGHDRHDRRWARCPVPRWKSFAAALTDASFAGRDHLYMDGIRAEPFDAGRPGWTVRTADWKLIEYDDGGAPELFDMRSESPSSTTSSREASRPS